MWRSSSQGVITLNVLAYLDQKGCVRLCWHLRTQITLHVPTWLLHHPASADNDKCPHPLFSHPTPSSRLLGRCCRFCSRLLGGFCRVNTFDLSLQDIEWQLGAGSLQWQKAQDWDGLHIKSINNMTVISSRQTPRSMFQPSHLQNAPAENNIAEVCSHKFCTAASASGTSTD
jgi:hypothetical protein